MQFFKLAALVGSLVVGVVAAALPDNNVAIVKRCDQDIFTAPYLEVLRQCPTCNGVDIGPFGCCTEYTSQDANVRGFDRRFYLSLEMYFLLVQYVTWSLDSGNISLLKNGSTGGGEWFPGTGGVYSLRSTRG
ncbi:hypothetical protein B0H14DRAFT_2625712 [Mycena olivaceomarginata]|nr:hypothetical protein B0H14DRAFT_2625712 [Mycena olivaceomarginata]